MKPTDKRKKNWGNPIIDKLMQLKYRINDTFDSGYDDIVRDDEGMWKLIDGLLTQENRSKIGAIKILRRFTECNLREAKEAIDARQIKIERGW